MLYRVVDACLKFAGQLGALMEDVLRSTRAQSVHVTQARRDVLVAVQAMAGERDQHTRVRDPPRLVEQARKIRPGWHGA